MVPGRLSQAPEKAISEGILSHCMIPGRLSQATEKAIIEGILSHCMVPGRLSQATEKAISEGILSIVQSLVDSLKQHIRPLVRAS